MNVNGIKGICGPGSKNNTYEKSTSDPNHWISH